MNNSIKNLSKPFIWDHKYLYYLLCESKSRIVNNPNLQKAFSEIDRIDFIPNSEKDNAYYDKDILLGWDEYIDRPTTTALMLQLLDIKKGGRYLDIGTGSGYVTALISSAIGKRGTIITIERNQYITEVARINLSKYPFLKNYELIFADGKNGYANKAPYDGIHVSASYEEIPDSIKGQLKIGGKLVAPTSNNNLVLLERESVNSFKESLHKNYFFAKIKEGIV